MARDRALRVLLVLPYEPSVFMQVDIEILRRNFELDVVVHNRGEKKLARSTLMRQFLLHRPDEVLRLLLGVLRRFATPRLSVAITLRKKGKSLANIGSPAWM